MPIIRANGIDLYYEESGPADGPVILLARCLDGKMTDWPVKLVHGLVGKGFRVIYYDDRDAGLSQWLVGARTGSLALEMLAARLGWSARTTAYTLADMAQDGVALLGTLGIEKAHIVGGGGIGCRNVEWMAANNPDRLLSMTLINILINAEELEQISYSDTALLHAVMGRKLSRRQYVKLAKRPLLALFADRDRIERLKTIKVPTLVVRDGADLWDRMDHSGRYIPGARVEIVEKIATALSPSQVDRLVDLIADHATASAPLAVV